MKSFALFSLLTAALLGSVGALWAQPAASVVVPGRGNPTNGSALSRGPDPSKNYQRVVALYPAADVRGVAAGLPWTSLGFRLRGPGTAATSGTLRVWLCNTPDANYSLATGWAYLLQSPRPFQPVYSGPLTIPTAVGWYDVVFQTPFAFTGQGFYLAYEWETTAPVAVSGTYECDEYLYQGMRGDVSATAFPAQVSTVGSFRPQLRIGYAAPAQDAAVARVYGPGKTAALACVAPYPVQAVVRNAGTAPLANLPVTFTPDAGAGLPVTVTIPALAVGAETSVRLPGLSPALSAAGSYVRYTVQVPADQNPANDARRDSTLATAHDLTYVKGFPGAAFGTGSIGFGTAATPSGTLLCRYPLRAPALVNSVTLRINNNTANVGNTIFAVVLDEQGHLLGRSADNVITAAQNGPWLTLRLSAPVRVSGRAFFAGLAQTRPRVAGQWYYPLSTQAEAEVSDSAYYSAVGDQALLGLVTPGEFRALGRFMIEVSLDNAPLAARAGAAPWVAEVWPVPAHDRLQVALPPGAGPATAALLDAAGRVVRPATPLRAAADQPATLDLSGLASGVYVLRLSMAAGQQHRRVVVE